MPELPEVETVRKGLAQLVLGKVITDVVIGWPNMIVTKHTLEQWRQQLIGQQIVSLRRRAKYLLIGLTTGELVVHLRMEGKFHFVPAEEVSQVSYPHIHVRFYFSDGSCLCYQDVRKFGRFEWIATAQEAHYFEQKRLGPEPTEADFTLSDFQTGLKQTKRAIKPVLLDQHLVVGLGNIYVDEALFRAEIHPAFPANQLQMDQVVRLRTATIQVLAEAVEAGGSTIRTYRNSLGEAGTFQTALAVYGRQGKMCIRCGHLIEKLKLAQRGTHYCPICQPKV